MALFTERLEGDQANALDHLEGLFDHGIDGAVLTTSTLDGRGAARAPRRGLPFTFLTRVVDSIAADCRHRRQRARRVADGGGGRAVRSPQHRRDLRADEHEHGPRPRARLPRRAESGRASRSTTARCTAGRTRSTSGREAMEAIMALDDRPTVGRVLQRPRRHRRAQRGAGVGLRVPEDVSITGWDDLPMASWEICRLTTVRQSMHEMARAAARLVVERVEATGAAGAAPRCCSIPSWCCARRSGHRPAARAPDLPTSGAVPERLDRWRRARRPVDRDASERLESALNARARDLELTPAVTLLARLRGWSMSRPRCSAAW